MTIRSLASASVVATVLALSASSIAAPPPKLDIDIHREKLPNGLRVVLAPDRTSPTVAVDVVYDVGGRNEERGHSGFAHL
ncbi:MAG: zinc protease, partial [Myxococcaceae bacterium]|nr:zinc protease [Myxococcaceae bacterium]